MKKMISILLALSMLLGLATVALGAEEEVDPGASKVRTFSGDVTLTVPAGSFTFVYPGSVKLKAALLESEVGTDKVYSKLEDMYVKNPFYTPNMYVYLDLPKKLKSTANDTIIPVYDWKAYQHHYDGVYSAIDTTMLDLTASYSEEVWRTKKFSLPVFDEFSYGTWGSTADNIMTLQIWFDKNNLNKVASGDYTAQIEYHLTYVAP